jgi:hypothetical protein
MGLLPTLASPRLVDEARTLHRRLLDRLDKTPVEFHTQFDRLYFLTDRSQRRLDRRTAAWLDAQLDEIRRVGAEARAIRAQLTGVA